MTTTRPVDTGRKDALGRTVRVAGTPTEQRATAPAPPSSALAALDTWRRSTAAPGTAWEFDGDVRGWLTGPDGKFATQQVQAAIARFENADFDNPHTEYPNANLWAIEHGGVAVSGVYPGSHEFDLRVSRFEDGPITVAFVAPVNGNPPLAALTPVDDEPHLAPTDVELEWMWADSVRRNAQEYIDEHPEHEQWARALADEVVTLQGERITPVAARMDAGYSNTLHLVDCDGTDQPDVGRVILWRARDHQQLGRVRDRDTSSVGWVFPDRCDYERLAAIDRMWVLTFARPDAPAATNRILGA